MFIREMGQKKDLTQMSLEELWQLFPIILSRHKPEWKEWAANEILTVTNLLSAFSPIVNHIGSTAVPDITAKPIIDILVEIPDEYDFENINPLLEANGYICMSASSARMSFNKGYTPEGFAEKVFHIHIRRTGDNDEIYFRDYLKAHPDIAHKYAMLKESLLPEYTYNRDGYTEAKSNFVREITDKAKKSSK